MRANWSWVAAAVALAMMGCTSDVVGSAESSLGLVCEPTHETPLLDVETATLEAGVATITASEGGIDIHLDAASGWELGDHYIGVGPGPDALTWHTLNPEPWVTGWVTSLDLHVSLEELGVACGERVKVIIQGYARDPAGREQVSALGEGDLGGWGWYSFYDVCCAPVDQGCTLTQGYWKNHAEAWPVSSLVLGGRSYDAAALLAILRTAPRGDASLILAHQLIAAELNAASGATASTDLAAAHAWLAANAGALPQGVRASSATGAAGVAIADALAGYNEGATGPGHCD
ncbi:hypothetical protein [Sandaracinus amylolyticus]|uniref:hypothetical protein n=1 Tax=Sandaracinus amylolyticus TaxID=927083 RepID=UPI001F1E0BEB|nr:hypothetical protein [Sandaracinus amylolyticus]UJR78209.1 Hypothetical protein I5071_2360 [Sandaracinus amylolyticus]